MNHRKKVLLIASALLSILIIFLLYYQNNTSSLFGYQSQCDTTMLINDIEKAKELLKADQNNKSNLEKAKALIEKAQKASTECNFYKGIGRTMLLKAKILEQAQNKKESMAEVDRAITLFKKHQLIADLAEAYSQMGMFYSVERPELDKRISYFEEAQKYYQQAGLKLKQGDILKELGDYMIINGNHLKAQRVLNNALSVYKSIDHKPVHGVYDLLSQVNVRLANYKKAVSYSELALKTALTFEKRSPLLCTIYNRLGSAQFLSKDFLAAEQSFRLALEMARYYKIQQSILEVTINLANTLKSEKKYKECISMLNGFLNSGYPLGIEEKNTINLFILASYSGLDNLTEAEKTYRSLLKSLDGNEGPDFGQYAYLDMIEYQIKLKNFPTAKKLIAKAEGIYLKNKMITAIKNIYRLSFVADSVQGNLKAAIQSYQKFKTVSDSIFLKSKEKQFENLEKQFTSERELQDELNLQGLQLLKTKAELQHAQLEQAKGRSYIYMGGTFFLVILLGLGYRINLAKQRKNLLLEKQKLEIDQQNISMKRLIDQQVKLISEKEWLVKEVHHRVKNNLQIIVSLLNFQSKYLQDQAAKTAINNSKNRIKTMSIIHQRLYQTDTLKFIDMKLYINELVQYFKDAFADGRHIEFVLDLSPVNLEVSQVVPIGLILNETVTNSIKYAFTPQQIDPRITIGFDQDQDGICTLTIGDNGTGLDQDFELKNTKSLGFNLIQTMSEQLYAELLIENNPGLKLIFKFKNEQTMDN